MKFEQSPQLNSKDQITGKEFPVIENSLEDKSWEEKYKTELLPLIEILKPENISIEDYESQILNNLFDSVKKIQVAKGKLIEDPEKTLDEVRTLLISRLNTGITEEKKKNEKSDFAIKAEAALIISGELYDGWKQNKSTYRNEETLVGEKTKPLFEKYIVEGNFEMVTHLLNNLDKSGKLLGEKSLYHGLTPRYGGGNWSDNDQRLILTGKMPYWVFNRGKDIFEQESTASRKLIPKAHYSRTFLKDLVRDNHGMLSIGLFKDHKISSELDEKIQNISKGEEEDKEFIVNMDDTEVGTITKAIKEKAKENYYAFDLGGRRKDLFSIFEKEDFEDLIKNNIPLSDIRPSDIPKSIDPEARNYLVGLWKLELGKNGNIQFSSDNPQIEMANVFNFFSADDMKELILKNIEVDFTLVPSSRFDDLFSDKDFQGKLFKQAKEKAGNEKVKIEKLQNIQESFLVLDGKEKLPKQILETLERFEDQYGKKGKHLVALAISAYGIENPDVFSQKMKTIDEILNKYDPTQIPQGAHVSMGIEYETTWGMNKFYEDSLLGYKKDIELVSRSANIGRGNDGMHEIALKPTYNPYMLLAEVKLLQDAGFLDFNFKKYPDAPRGYHLSLVGESGLNIDKNTHFLYNVMTLSQLTGALAGKELKNTKSLSSKSFEIFENNKQGGSRVEIKGMGCDTIEQFEKAVLTAHHAGIAIQLCNEHFLTEVEPTDTPNTAEDFQKMLSNTRAWKPFKDNQERDIVFEWFRLKKEVVEAIRQHNESFVDSEFVGYFFDKDGNYIDTGEHIDIIRNKKLLKEEDMQSESFMKKLSIDPEKLFITQDPELINPLIRINNIFLKGPQGQENSSVNAGSMLGIVKQKNYGSIQDGEPTESIFEKQGNLREGYYVVQGASEEMISHKIQILLNNFNQTMENLIKNNRLEKIQNPNLVSV